MRLGLSSGLSHSGFIGGVSPIDPATLNPYLYFRADPAAGGSITTVGGAVSSWSQVTTSGGNQITRDLVQPTANQQPQHDNTDKHITFDNTDDDLIFNNAGSNQSITQAGIWFSATKRGVWVQEIDNSSFLVADALGPDQGFPQDEDVYAITLLPNTLTDSQIEGVVLWLLENTSAEKVTESNLYRYRRSQFTALRVFKFGIDTSSVTSFFATWQNCSSLTSFPLIDTSSGTNFHDCWRNCTGLTSFPAIDTSSATNLNATWLTCNSLTSFPTIDSSNVTNFVSAWANCSSLTSFPSIDTSSGTNFNSTWLGCSALTSFPTIDTSSAFTFSSTWRNCSGLTSFPALDCSGVKTFYRTWRECDGLTTFPANFFDSWNPVSIETQVFNSTWDSCSALTATSVENILVSIAASGKHGTDDGTGSGTALADATIDIDYNASTGSLSAATNTAINTLISRGWSVKINNVLTVPSLLALSPAAAYSLRSFDSSADPNVVNVRRSSDNATQDFKASEITDGTLATYVGSGNDGFVTEWYDQSGNNVTATQATASDQPKIVSSGTVVLENGKPAIDMNIGGTADRIDVSQNFRASNINNYSLFTVQRASGSNGAFGIRLGGAPDSRGYLPYNSSGTNYASYGNNITAISLGSPPTDSQLLSLLQAQLKAMHKLSLTDRHKVLLHCKALHMVGIQSLGQALLPAQCKRLSCSTMTNPPTARQSKTTSTRTTASINVLRIKHERRARGLQRKGCRS